jgi:uncharacterized protein YegL
MTTIDYSGNPNQRTPCVLVLDMSGSMNEPTSGRSTRINDLTIGIKQLEESLKEDPTALVRVQLAIVSVGGPARSADIMMDWTDATHFESFPFQADGSTPLGDGLKIGLQLVEQAKSNLKASGISYTRPWMMVITDGEPTDDSSVWASAVQECRAAEASHKVEIFAIGVKGANLSKISEITTKPPLMLDGMKFKELFVWLSASLSAASRSRPGDKLELPSTDPWRNVGI